MLSVVASLVEIFLIAIGAGTLGALLGLGGGLVIVPALVLLFDIDVRVAIACSLLSVIATSAGSSSRYAKQGLIHLRLGFFLEVATIVGSVLGAVLTAVLLTGTTGEEVLYAVFAAVAVSAAVLLLRSPHGKDRVAPRPDPLADRWRLHGRFPAQGDRPGFSFRVGRVREGLGLSFVAGVASGMLGIGGGLYKVPAMAGAMGVPMKMASATSSLMIGVTAAGGAIVYLLQGDVSPWLVAPIALGTLVGSVLGARSQAYATSRELRLLFVVVILIEAAVMIAHGLGVSWA